MFKVHILLAMLLWTSVVCRNFYREKVKKLLQLVRAFITPSRAIVPTCYSNEHQNPNFLVKIWNVHVQGKVYLSAMLQQNLQAVHNTSSSSSDKRA